MAYIHTQQCLIHSPFHMNKKDIINIILTHLHEELSITEMAAHHAHSAAIDDQSVAETQYDTLAIEASYLAEGQSKRVEEIKHAITLFEQLQTRELSADTIIKIGTLVQLEKEQSNNKWFFIAPAAGGFTCSVNDNNKAFNITVITPFSPMGKALINKEVDDEVSLNFQGAASSLEQPIDYIAAVK